jgi:hypothetical protein
MIIGVENVVLVILFKFYSLYEKFNENKGNELCYVVFTPISENDVF